MPNPHENLPGKGLFGWLGRQVGYVSGADKAKPVAAPAAKPAENSPAKPAAPVIVYRDDKVEEVPHPTQPGVTLRRTIIDEVVVEDDAPDADRGGKTRGGSR